MHEYHLVPPIATRSPLEKGWPSSWADAGWKADWPGTDAVNCTLVSELRR